MTRTTRCNVLAVSVLAAAVLSVCGDLRAQCVMPPPGLVSWWPMEGDASDLTGANEPVATQAVQFVPGHIGLGATFGPGGYIHVRDSESLTFERFTIEAWVRPDGPGPNPDSAGSAVLAKSVSGDEETASVFWRSIDARFVFIFGRWPGDVLLSRHSFPPGRFYHVAATCDGNTFRLYVNGLLEGEKARSRPTTYDTAIDWVIGAQAPQFPNHPRTWNGVIDELTIYGRALAATEIGAIYRAGPAGKCQDTARAIGALASLARDVAQRAPQRGIGRALLVKVRTAHRLLTDEVAGNDPAALAALHAFLQLAQSRPGQRVLGPAARDLSVQALRAVALLNGLGDHAAPRRRPK